MARMRPVVTASLAVLISLRCADGRDSASAPIATDRPAVTASSVVVPAGSLQAENGFTETSTQGQRTFDGPETLLRLGVASTTELRLVIPNYFWQVGVGSGFGDIAIGVKQQLGTTGNFDISVILSLSMPSGSSRFSSHGYDPSVQFPWSRTLASGWTVAGMLSVYGQTVNGRRNTTGETTLLFDRQLTKSWDAYLEYVGDFPEQGGPRHLAHFGTAYKLSPRQQIDFHVAVGMSSAAVNHFIGVGYSLRGQAFKR